jgi:DNA-binding transcriptional regulator YhcF (GntR family)
MVYIVQENLNEEKSIYLQISEMIENDILKGSLAEEERVPSTNELARFYKINPATAMKGVNILVDEGILYKQRGIGMFVSGGAKEMIKDKRKKSFYNDYVKAMLEEAKSLGISKDEIIKLIDSGK